MNPNPTELQLIGYFETLLKQRVSEKGGALSVANLSNSAPDTVFGDTIFGVNSKFVIIEFKRDSSSIGRELNKPLRQSLCSYLSNPNFDTYKTSSSKAHWLAWGMEKTKFPQLLIGRYMRIVCEKENLRTSLNINANSYIDNLIDPSNVSIVLLPEKFKKYLDFLEGITKKTSGNDTSFDNLQNETAALLLIYDLDRKKLLASPEFYSLRQVITFANQLMKNMGPDLTLNISPPKNGPPPPSDDFSPGM